MAGVWRPWSGKHKKSGFHNLVYGIGISRKQAFVCVYVGSVWLRLFSLPFCEVLTIQISFSILQTQDEMQVKIVRGRQFAAFHRSSDYFWSNKEIDAWVPLQFFLTLHMTWKWVCFILHGRLGITAVPLGIACSAINSSFVETPNREQTYWRTVSLCGRDNLTLNVLLIEGSD